MSRCIKEARGASLRKPAQQGNAGKQLADDDDEGSYQGRRGNLCATCPIFERFPLSAACQKRGGIVAFFDEALRGVGQVFFCNSPISGFLMLAGVFASDALVGAFCVFGVCLATWFARILNLDKNLLASGIWGYNGALVGCAFAAFTLPPVYNSGASASLPVALSAAIGVTVMSPVSVLITSALASLCVPKGVTPLTLPFQLATWLYFLAASSSAHVEIPFALSPTLLINASVPDAAMPFLAQGYDASNIVKAVFRGIAQTFLVSEWYSGVLMMLGIAACSPISSAWCVLGALLGTFTAMALGIDVTAVDAGLYGYNACLCGMALAGFFFVHRGWKIVFVASFASVLSTIATASLASFFAPVGLPPLTFPFVFCTWIVILAGSSIPELIAVAIPALTTAEDHLERLLLSEFVSTRFECFGEITKVASHADMALVEKSCFLFWCAVRRTRTTKRRCSGL